ncbi:hypothetical protein DICSQDRAFT_128341 [Dichomitus squalens LYAD-421 SS1]|uniref:Carbohydrate esterase family 16 protein n=1 Tax=Dichomitus squalens (strain LYAD-421) TaxID=732165 RepID=R7STC7_DICSQ|nr:uncharacterized protein DICSQDRAFT_128341 [Dichomitus squalens LYAD-421 SS1]EJF59316.1 hypothetical protein DICSQDRAFT_128341 [Dichomitus squalens LYAD-421 SS1]
MLRELLAAAALVPLALAAGPAPGQIKNLVMFDDSYTDIDGHEDGGTVWPVFAAQDGNFALFPFAKVGATCSNTLTFRPFPSLFESQLPTYFSEKSNGSLTKLRPEDTIYTLWIGTNDVGANALLTGSQAPGVTLVDTVTCAVNWVKTLYNSGARNFIFQNRNTTEWSVFMRELTTAGNAIARLELQLIAPTLHGAHIGLFDSHALLADMYARPGLYLNGSAPLNVTGAAHACVYQFNESQLDPGVCKDVPDRDSYLWQVASSLIAGGRDADA